MFWPFHGWWDPPRALVAAAARFAPRAWCVPTCDGDQMLCGTLWRGESFNHQKWCFNADLMGIWWDFMGFHGISLDFIEYHRIRDLISRDLMRVKSSRINDEGRQIKMANFGYHLGDRLLSLEVLENIRCKTYKPCRSGYRLASLEMCSTLNPP
jgi:hypothetical protein